MLYCQFVRNCLWFTDLPVTLYTLSLIAFVTTFWKCTVAIQFTGNNNNNYRFTGQSALAGTSIWELEEFVGAQFYCPHALDQFWGWGKNWAVCHCYSENYKVVQRFIWADIGSIVMSMVNLYWYRQYCLFYECCSHCRFQPHGCAIICFMESIQSTFSGQWKNFVNW